jgi:hypothetical protein
MSSSCATTLCIPHIVPGGYAWDPSQGYMLSQSPDSQLASWWSFVYNASLQHQQYQQYQQYLQQEKEAEEARLRQEQQQQQQQQQLENEAVKGLLSLSISPLPSNPNPPPTKLRQASNSLRRKDLVNIFGSSLQLPIKCVMRIEVDGKVVSERKSEIRGNENTVYMVPYDFALCKGYSEVGTFLASYDSNSLPVLVRRFVK